MKIHPRQLMNVVCLALVLWPLVSLLLCEVYPLLGLMISLGGGLLLILAGGLSGVTGALLLVLNLIDMRKKKIPLGRPWQVLAALVVAVWLACAAHGLLIASSLTCKASEECARGI